MTHHCSLADQLRGRNRPVAHTPPDEVVRIHIISDERRDMDDVLRQTRGPAAGSCSADVLAALPATCGKTAKRLAEDVGRRIGTVDTALRRLHDLGLVKRRRGARGRRALLWWRVA